MSKQIDLSRQSPPERDPLDGPFGDAIIKIVGVALTGLVVALAGLAVCLIIWLCAAILGGITW